MSKTYIKTVCAAVMAGVQYFIPDEFITDVVINHQSVRDEVGICIFIRKLLEAIDSIGLIL
jgi:hypothetical protein